MSGGREEKLETEHGATVIEAGDESLQPAAVFHIIKDLIGFVLYMHQQIPSCVQDLINEFETMQAEKLEMESERGNNELLPRERRRRMMELREYKQNIRKLEKLMHSYADLENALRLVISQTPWIETVALALGSSPIRPYCVYDLSLSRCSNPLENSLNDFAKSKPAELLSRKVIRTLISCGAGTSSYPGAWKLFLFVKAPSTLDLPHHFLPKREFKFCKKIVPFKLLLKSRIQDMNFDSPTDENSSKLIWFQCRHVVTGLASNDPIED